MTHNQLPMQVPGGLICAFGVSAGFKKIEPSGRGVICGKKRCQNELVRWAEDNVIWWQWAVPENIRSRAKRMGSSTWSSLDMVFETWKPKLHPLHWSRIRRCIILGGKSSDQICVSFFYTWFTFSLVILVLFILNALEILARSQEYFQHW